MRLIALLLLVLPAIGSAQFTDSFTGAGPTTLEGWGGNWTNTTGTRDRLKILSNQLATEGIASSVTAYLAPDQGDPDMYAQASFVYTFGTVLTAANEHVIVRATDRDNFIGAYFQDSSGTDIIGCRVSVAGVETGIGVGTSTDVAGLVGLRVECTGTTCSCSKMDGDAVWEQYATGTVTDHASVTTAGFKSGAANGTGDGTPLWDNFETGVLATDEPHRRRHLLRH